MEEVLMHKHTERLQTPDSSERSPARSIPAPLHFGLSRRLSEQSLNRTMSKRKRVVLNFQQKLDILHQLEGGKSGALLAKEYGIGTSTISDIKRNADAILQFVSNLDCQRQISEKKTRKTAQNTDLDARVYKWYVEEREKGAPPTDAAICATALHINVGLSNANVNFKASPGWLRHFKNRHGIREAKEGEPQPRQLRTVLKRGGYTLENVYRVEEGVLEWKSLPHLDSKPGNAVATILCANANASHKLRLWVAGAEASTMDFPLVYKQTRAGRLTEEVFEDWFENHFVPEVTTRQQSNGNVGKILLVVDDHHVFKYQNRVDVFHLQNEPGNGFKRAFKLLYRKKLLQSLVDKPLKQFLEEFSFSESLSLMAETWDSLAKSSISQSWGRLLYESKASSDEDEVAEILALAGKIPGLDGCTQDNLAQWLDGDKENGYLYAGDEVDFISGYPDEDLDSGPSHIEAYQSLDTVMQWLKRQEECNSAQLSCLQNLHDLAASKICGKIKQEKD